jgi:hypothetical protein
MKDHTYLITPQFIEAKSKKIAMLAGEIGFCLKTWIIVGTKGTRKPWLQYCQLNIGKSSNLLLLRSIK